MDSSAQELLFRELKDTILQLNITIQKQSEEFNRTTAELRAAIEQRDAQIAAQAQELAKKQEQIDYLINKMFGKSSEKRSPEQPGQITLEDLGLIFNEAEAEADPNAPEPGMEEVAVKAHTRKKKPSFKERYANLPTEKVVHELSEDQQVCGRCGTKLQKVGEKFVRREFEIIPQKVKVIEHYETTYKCVNCEKESSSYGDLPYLFSASAPPALIPHSMASPSVVSMVLSWKFINGVPFYRQEPMWEREGISLSRATMANWCITCSEEYFSVMYNYFRRCLLGRKYLLADETSVQVLKEPDRAPDTKSYMWLYRTGEDDLPPIMLFEYQETRKGQNAADFLKGFRGYLHTDGYAGYNKVEGVTRCCCWAHMRRKFWDAIPTDQRKNPDYSLPAAQGLEYIDKLFDIEKKINQRRDISYELRYELRLQQEKPVLEAYWSWLEKQVPVKGTKFYHAVNYAANRKEELMNYLKDGHCSMSTNAAERLAKTFVIGRKNWLFAATPKGAQASAICYTMVEIAKANKVEPYKYLVYLLEQRPNCEMSDMELSKFAPWSEEVKAALAN